MTAIAAVVLKTLKNNVSNWTAGNKYKAMCLVLALVQDQCTSHLIMHFCNSAINMVNLDVHFERPESYPG